MYMRSSSIPARYPKVSIRSSYLLPAGNLLSGRLHENKGMGDKYEFRRQRLIRLRDEQCGGRVAELARRIDRAPSYVSRLLYPEGKAGKKRIADEMLDVIGAVFPGWLDSNDEPNPKIVGLKPAYRLPAPLDELVEIASNMSPQGQWELVGQARMLAARHPVAKANRVKS